MIKIKEAVIVEGKYDKMQLSKVCDALIITTDGFRIFKDKDKREFLKALAQRQGLIILTDSDRAGFVIRSHLKSFIPQEFIKNITDKNFISSLDLCVVSPSISINNKYVLKFKGELGQIGQS